MVCPGGTSRRTPASLPGFIWSAWIRVASSAHPSIPAAWWLPSCISAPGLWNRASSGTRSGNRISLGEPDGSRTERCRAIADALIESGLRCPITARIRHEIWVKILGNVAFNPISALTGATLAAMARDPGVNALVRSIMAEVEAVAKKLGLDLPISIEQRIAGAEKVGEHKTSMLQDLEAGRPMELEAIVGAVVELGERMGVPTPHTSTVYACTRLLGDTNAKTNGEGD